MSQKNGGTLLADTPIMGDRDEAILSHGKESLDGSKDGILTRRTGRGWSDEA